MTVELTNTDSVKTSILVTMADDFFNMTKNFTATYRADDFDGGLTRFLVFRMLNLGAQWGDPHQGEVIACNINPSHNNAAAGPTPTQGYVVFSVSTADAGHPSDIGKDGGKAAIAPPQSAPRVLTPDLTGSYEADSIDADGNSAHDYNYDPPLMVHINQAGHSIVGWFSPPPSHTGAKASMAPSIIPKMPGCFLSNGDPGPDGWNCEYFIQSDGDPARNVTDPDQGTGRPIEPIKSETIRIKVVSGTPDDVALALEMLFEQQLSTGGPPQRTTLRLLRTGVATRIPFLFLRAVLDGGNASDARKLEFAHDIVQQQIEVLPTTFWERMTDTLGARLLPLIQGWVDADGKDSDKNNARESIASQVLADIIPLPSRADELAARKRAAAPKLRALLRNIDIRLGNGDVRSAQEWIQTMVDDRVAAVMRDIGKSPTEIFQQSQYVEAPYRDFGFAPSGQFVCTVEFLTKGGAFPAIIFVGAYAFDMTVKKELESKDSSGNVSRIRVDTPGWNGSEGKKLLGAIAQAGVGLAFDFKKLKIKTKGLSDVPGTIEFHTCVDIPSVDDFDGATFTVNAVKVGTFNVVVAKGAVINSAFLQFTLKSGAVLETDVEANMTIKPQFEWKRVLTQIKDKKPKSAGDLLESAKDLLIPEVTILQYIWSGGAVFFPTTELGRAPELTPALSAEREKRRQTEVVMFDVDSATLDTVNRGWLETRIAIDRAIFETPNGTGTAVGFASPEASEDHNQKLTEMRAQAVTLAVQDALGGALAFNLKHEGRGELPSRDEGKLMNPPDPPSSIAQLPEVDRRRLLKEKTTAWAWWRRVDLHVDSLLVLRVMGRGARAD